MADYLTTDTELTSVANAIRVKGGTSASLTYPTGFVSAIQAIPAGGGSWQDVSSQFEYGDGSCEVEIIALKNGSRVILAAVITDGPNGLDGAISVNVGCQPSTHFTTDDVFPLTVYCYDGVGGYSPIEFAYYLNDMQGFDLAVASQIYATANEPVYCICMYEV